MTLDIRFIHIYIYIYTIIILIGHCAYRPSCLSAIWSAFATSKPFRLVDLFQIFLLLFLTQFCDVSILESSVHLKIFSRKSNSTFTNVYLLVCHQNPSKSAYSIIEPNHHHPDNPTLILTPSFHHPSTILQPPTTMTTPS